MQKTVWDFLATGRMVLCAGLAFWSSAGLLTGNLLSAPAAVSLLPADPLAQFRPGGAPERWTTSRVPVQGQPFREAVRIQVKQRPAQPYEMQVRFPNAGAVAKGDTLHLRFYARALAAPGETGEGALSAVFERATQPYEKSLQARLAIGREWKLYEQPFRATHAFAPGQAQLTFQAGFDPQVLEIGGFELLNYGASVAPSSLPATAMTYRGREANAAWRTAAAERIKKHRQGDLSLAVTDAAGRPVSGVEVKVEMRRHAFAFGSAVTAELLTAQTEDARRYREIIERDFNRVVFENDLKWPSWERESARPRLMAAVDWLRGRNIEIRGHCLVWPSWKHVPGDVKKLAEDRAALAERVRRHIREEAGALRGKLVDWDVINEPYSNHDLMDILGREVMVEWFKLAREADPQARLYLNDYSILSAGGRDAAHQRHFEETLRFLKDSGAPLGGIGMQGHFGSDLTPPERLLEVLDRFAQLGLPIQVTEHDINVTDESLQADYTRDFLTAIFSHPSVVGILTWGFWEGRHWRPNGAYYRRDWSLRPAGQAWRDLVRRDWWTVATVTTDAAGAGRVRGFLGEYEITARQGGKVVSTRAKLPQVGAKVTLRLPSDG